MWGGGGGGGGDIEEHIYRPVRVEGGEERLGVCCGCGCGCGWEGDGHDASVSFGDEHVELRDVAAHREDFSCAHGQRGFNGCTPERAGGGGDYHGLPWEQVDVA